MLMVVVIKTMVQAMIRIVRKGMEVLVPIMDIKEMHAMRIAIVTTLMGFIVCGKIQMVIQAVVSLIAPLLKLMAKVVRTPIMTRAILDFVPHFSGMESKAIGSSVSIAI
tara:strand:+ start:445 stop:771 length:327 start_codon:yes stop_codon:yes gene_type:complete